MISQFDIKTMSLVQEKDALIEQINQLHEENSELVKENQDLRDLDHQNQLNNISQ